MTRILLGLVLLGAVSFVVLRMMSPTRPSGDDPVAVVGDTASPNVEVGPRTGAGATRFRELMEKATGQAGGQWADADALREFVQRVDPSRLSFGELNELFESLGDDPQTGLILMDRVLEDSERSWPVTEKTSLFRRAGALAAVADLAGVEERLDALTDPGERQLFVQGAADGLARESVENSLMWIGTLSDQGLQVAALHGVGKAWAADEREDALKWVSGLESDEEKAQALQGVISSWVHDDADAAIAYAHEAPDELADGLIVEAARSIALTDPKTASEWVVTAHSDPQQMEILEEGVTKWAEDDFEGVVAWANLVHRSDLRDTAMISLADQWSATEPKKATEWAAEFPTKEARARMLQRTIPAWAQANPTEAADWVTGLPVDLSNINIIKDAVRTFGESDPDAARAWLEQINSPAFRQIGGGVLDSL